MIFLKNIKMNADDLQLNDLIFHRKEEIVQVTDLYDGYVSTKDYKDSHDYHFQPIPITEEILLKIGFKKVNSQRFDYGEFESDCYIRINVKKEHIYVNGINGNHCNVYDSFYIHTLQQALRICGLKELANNFEIE